jgi:hypothetical protein
MEKHSVPQNIMDVEFKLFGSLTMRQFTYLAVTFIFALLIYFSGMPKLASVPIIFIMVLIGLGLALLTVNDQPFSVWFTNFIKSLFTSQRRVYHKSAKAPESLRKTVTQTKVQNNVDNMVEESAERRKALTARLQKDKKPEEGDVQDEVEDPFLVDGASRLDQYFTQKVNENMQAYDLKPNVASSAANSTVATVKPVEVPPVDVPAVEQVVKPQVVFKPQPKVNLDPEAKIQITMQNNSDPRPLGAVIGDTDQKVRTPGNAQPADSAEPQLKVMNRLKPNQVAGFVCKKDDSPLDKAQVLLKDSKGNLLRSVYSDAHGKFIIPSTLPDGHYIVEISAPGQTFPEYQVELKGELLPMYRYLAQ